MLPIHQPQATNETRQTSVLDEENPWKLYDVVGEGDPLGHGAIRAPLKDMLTAVASVGSKGGDDTRVSNSKQSEPSAARTRKRIKLDAQVSTDDPRHSRSVWSKGSYTQQHLDPITSGIVSMVEAERLFNLSVHGTNTLII